MTGAGHPADTTALAYQKRALLQVSRTFALTIPVLPAPVRHAIGNAYLLCRIADTIEDEPAMDAPCKRRHLHVFSEVMSCRSSPEKFATDLAASLSGATPGGERDLVANLGLVVGFHQGLPAGQREPIERCVKAMCGGMAEFVETGPEGLDSMARVDRYCHYVAGLVGEMITDVLCDYSSDIAACREELFPLGSRFGRGLQLVNILKDHPEDRRRGVTWLPRAALANGSQEPSSVPPADATGDFRILHMVDVAREHLEAALRYTLLIPARETGVRRFLAWTLGFAALTLRRIHANPGFERERDVRIPRRQVYAAIAASNVALRSNRALRSLFEAVAPPRRREEPAP